MTRIIFLLALATLRVTAGDWPQFRGPGASGLGDGANPPVTWNGQTGARIAWKTPIPGLSVASPVIWGDNIYLVTAISGDASQTFRTGLYGDTDSVADSSRHIWKVLALDKNTGKILWDRTAHERRSQDQAPPQELASVADSRHKRRGCGGLFRLRGPLRLLRGRKAPVEQGSRQTERGLVLRSRLGVGCSKLARDPRRLRDCPMRPAAAAVRQGVSPTAQSTSTVLPHARQIKW